MKKVFITLTILVMHHFTFAQASKDENYFETSKNLDIYYALFKELSQSYVDPIQPGKLVKISIDAMLDKLDPYTNYITEDDIEDFRFQTTGKYGGIGTGIRQVNDDVVIDEPYENSPASKVGLHSGDIIMAIDGKSTKGLNDDEVRKLVKGSPGTSVKFTVKDPFTNSETVKTIIREEINIHNVINSTLLGNKDIAYVRLTQFTERASANIKSALDSLKKVNPNIKAVILDLRGNPGGLLDEAVNVCNLFLNREQLIVSTKSKVEEWIKEYKTSNLAWDEKVPVAILINRGSASASEIVSGTLQDLDRGVVIGQKSFGKGLVQTTRNLPFNAKVKITTAKYYTPSGRCIQALDYTHRNEDGSVGEVPDSIKREFKTKAGRKVFDGGGIEPDIKTKAKESNKVLAKLYNDNYIFKFANKYAYEHKTISTPSAFNLSETELNSFFDYLKSEKFHYKSKTEETLEKVKASAEKEKYFDKIKISYEALLNNLEQNTDIELQQAKADIKRALQSEIVTRYYFQKGRVENEMLEDDDIKEAIKILNDQTTYQKLLGR
jgi:carboxyl-terminal processing protease